MLERVAHIEDGELEVPDLVHLQDEPDHLGNLLMSSVLPLAIGHLRQAWQAPNDEPVLF